MSKQLRYGYVPDTGLSETRKVDRRKMAETLMAICMEHGVDSKLHEDWHENKGAWAVQINEPHGLSVTVDFSPGSIQPNIFVLPWHFMLLPERRDRGWEINPEVFLDHNTYHFRKATDVAHGWENLKAIVTRRVKQIADGTATIKKHI